MTTTDQKTTSGRYRTADGRALITWELTAGENGPEFSACGEFDGGAGQCIHHIARAFPQDEKVQRIARVWEAYHLNGMNAGLPVQRAEIARREQLARQKYPEAIYPDGSLNWYKVAELSGLKKEKFSTMGPGHYELVTLWLRQAKLYEVSIHQEIRFGTVKATGGFPPEVVTGARGYRYGERWVFNPIPAEVLAEIESWSDFGPDDGKSLGDHQAAEFLARNEIGFRITLSDTKPAAWQPAGHHYRVTLSKNYKTKRIYPARLVFDFWGSEADAHEGKDPSPHSVLSCIASDIDTPETFAEFCSEYGDDSDSRKALQTFNRAHRHAVKLREFFTDAERTELQNLR